jgi:hypothetical protein
VQRVSVETSVAAPVGGSLGVACVPPVNRVPLSKATEGMLQSHASTLLNPSTGARPIIRSEEKMNKKR